MPHTLAQLEAFVSSPHYDAETAGLIALGIPALKAAGVDGELISPGVRRIRGNLCNVHGKYGPCDKSLSGKKKPGKGRAARKPAPPKPTDAQRASERDQKRSQNASDVAKRMAESDTGLAPQASKNLLAFAQGQQPDAAGGAGLAQMGLAERATDGSYRMTPTGRAVVSAMQAGDYQRAVDAISRGSDSAGKRQERTTAQQARQESTRQRQQEAATRRQTAAAERAKRQQERAQKKPAKASAGGAGGDGGSKKPEARAVEQPRQSKPAKRVRRNSAPSIGSVASSAPKKRPPSPPSPPSPALQPRKAPAKQIAPALQESVQALSDGKELSEQDTQSLIRNGLAKLNKEGELILTAAGMRATQKESPAHTGVMVALYPDVGAAKAIAAQQGVTEPVDELHLTLAFLGDSSETALATNKDKLVTAIKQWATEKGQALKGTINGLGRFFHAEDDQTNAVFVSPDVPGLPELRQSLCDWIKQSGFDYAQNHGFTPHITVAYVPLKAPTPPIRIETPVAFKQITLAWGDERYDYPLGTVAQKETPFLLSPIAETAAPSFQVFKDATGRYRWVAQSSTAFQDRDREIVSTNALADDCDFADKVGTYGPLRWWHTPGLDLGECDFNAMHGRVLIESGTFKSEAIALKVARAAPQLEISLGFLHLPTEPDASGVFHHIRRFERSLVPRGKASNRFTAFRVKEIPMLDATKVAALKTLGFSDDDITSLQTQAAATEKSADAQQVAYKADEPAVTELPDVVINGVTYKAMPPSPPTAAEAVKDDGEGDMEVMAEEPMEEAVGGLTLSPEDLAAITEVFQTGLAQVMGALDLEKKVAGHVQGLLAPYQQAQATKDASDAERAEQIAQLQTALKSTQDQLNELLGLQPAVKAERASESSTTTINPWVPQDVQLLQAVKDQVSPSDQFAFGDLVENLFGNRAPGQA